MTGSRSTRTAAVLTALLVLGLPACQAANGDEPAAAHRRRRRPGGRRHRRPRHAGGRRDVPGGRGRARLRHHLRRRRRGRRRRRDDDPAHRGDQHGHPAHADPGHGLPFGADRHRRGGPAGLGDVRRDVTDRAAVERRLRVTSTPPVVGSWSWLSDRTVHYRPQEYWPAHAHVAVDVDLYGVDVGRGVHGQRSEHVEFDVGPEKVATVDATELVLRLHIDDRLVEEMPRSRGKPGSATPTGTYVVVHQSREYTMCSASYGVPLDAPEGYETPVEYASRLSNSGIFVHGAPWSVRDQGRRNVSHGSLNVSVADDRWFHENVGRGDVVEVRKAGPVMEVWNGHGDWNADWADRQAGSALGR